MVMLSAGGRPVRDLYIVNSIKNTLSKVIDEFGGLDIVHITHNDADAWGCAEILREFIYNPKYWLDEPNITLARNDIRTVFSKVEDADKNILEAIKDGLSGDSILFISDLRPMSQEVLKAVTDAIDAGSRIYIIDHHEIKEYEKDIFDKYKDNIYIEDTKYISAALAMFNILFRVNGCGISRVGFTEWLTSSGFAGWVSSMSAFAKDISDWDTWSWSDNNIEGNKAQILNMLAKKHGVEFLYDTGIVSFVSLYPGVYGLGSYGEAANFEYNAFCKEVDVYLATRNIRKYQHQNGTNTVIAFAEKYVSEMADTILKTIPGCKGVMFIDMNNSTVSLRSREDDSKILDYAILNGGGGHKKACGFKLKMGTGVKSAMYYFLYEYGLQDISPEIVSITEL